MALTSGFKFLVAWSAVSILLGCGALGGGGGNAVTPSLQRVTSATRPLQSPPPIGGTYRGSYTEKRNGKSYSGRFHMVVDEHNSKIAGPLDVRGGLMGPYNTFFVGKVRASGNGAELRFDAPQLGGYDVGVKVQAFVVSGNLTGAGHGGSPSQGNYQRWTFRATKE